jgi:excisionase family DNA binding protein
MQNNKKMVYDANDIMAQTGLSRKTVYELMNSKGFPSFRVGKRLLVNAELFQQWLNEQCKVR